jgi:hypothetical protein
LPPPPQEHADVVLLGANANSWESFTLVADWLADEVKKGHFASFGLGESNPRPHVAFVQETRIKPSARLLRLMRGPALGACS